MAEVASAQQPAMGRMLALVWGMPLFLIAAHLVNELHRCAIQSQ